MKSFWMVLALVFLGGLLPACLASPSRTADIAPLTGLWAAPPDTATPQPSPTATPAPITPTPAPAIIARSTATPLPLPSATASPAPSPTSTPVDWLSSGGRTADNLIFRGNPNAPVTMIDYSDFL